MNSPATDTASNSGTTNDVLVVVSKLKAYIKSKGSMSTSGDVNERLFLHMKPMEINVKGDLAIVLVIYTVTNRNRETDEITTESMAWTDVCLKENGRWAWIADHGSPVGSN